MLDQFLDFCDANGWRVAFHQCPPARLLDYATRGFSALKIGEEAVVALPEFALRGDAFKSLRSTVNRFAKGGYEARYYPAPLSDVLLREIRDVSNDWLAIEGRRERGFTLGAFRDDYVRDTPVMTVEDADGKILAFANIIADGVAGEATIDLMRRRQDSPNGTMDFLFIRMFEYLREVGFTRFSLGMAPFADLGTTPGSPTLERALGMLSQHLDRFFSVKGLRDYKDKFHPDWEARYLVYQSEVSLPIVTLAIMRLTEIGDE
jgi:phosphatidylglycerol lysyltransferase